MKYEPLDFSGITRQSVADRSHLVSTDVFARVAEPDAGAGADVLDTMPDVLGARNLRRLSLAIAEAHRAGRPVVLAFGGHVVKTGLSPLIIDLMERGIVTALATNGSGAIHDFEIAAVGHSSEDVGAGLEDGSWGMVAETAEALNGGAQRARDEGRGLGAALGRRLLEQAPPHVGLSLLATAARLDLPFTVHVGIGTDTVHMHGDADGAAIGAASMHDFRLLAAVIADLSGGVYLNVGSAVILPEVFVKALNVARNLGHEVQDFTTANLDMLRHYRPKVNVLDRPGGTAIEITGHHEINVPLLRWDVLRRLAGAAGQGGAA